MFNQDNVQVSTKSILNAKEDGTLPEFIADYINFGGNIKSLKESIKKSSGITKEELDEAYLIAQKKYLPATEIKAKSLNESFDVEAEDFEKPSDDYRDFSEIMGSVSTLFEDTNYDNIEIDTITVSDLLDGAIDNMPQDQIDRDLAAFKRYARELKVPKYVDLVVYVDADNEHDPDMVLSDGKLVELNDRQYTVYSDANMVAERLDGDYKTYLYFPTIDDAKKYIGLAENFLNGFSIDSVDNYVTIGDEIKIEGDDIKESLNKLDIITNNKYDFLNRFICEKYSDEQISEIKSALKEDKSIEKLDTILVKFGGEDELKELREMFGLTNNEKKRLEDTYLGKKVKVEIDDPYHPVYGEGIVELVDDIGQLHGTWGGLAAIPGEDFIEIIG